MHVHVGDLLMEHMTNLNSKRLAQNRKMKKMGKGRNENIFKTTLRNDKYIGLRVLEISDEGSKG